MPKHNPSVYGDNVITPFDSRLRDDIILKNRSIIEMLENEKVIDFTQIESIYTHRNLVESLDELFIQINTNKNISGKRKAMIFQIASYDSGIDVYRQTEFLLLAIHHYLSEGNETDEKFIGFLVKRANKFGKSGYEGILGELGNPKTWRLSGNARTKLRTRLHIDTIIRT